MTRKGLIALFFHSQPTMPAPLIREAVCILRICKLRSQAATSLSLSVKNNI